MFAFESAGFLTVANYIDFAIRLIVSAVCGGFIGLERERRFKNAGMRTHIIVAVTSCLMMLVSKYGFFDVVSIEGIRLQADVSRIAHGVVSAIGFLGAGVIFVRRESIVGLTTAAGMWATVGVGIALGAGLYSVGIFATVLMLVIQKALHSYHTKSHNRYTAKAKCDITKHNLDIAGLKAYISKYQFESRELTFTKDSNNNTIVSVNLMLPVDFNMEELMDSLQKDNVLDSVEIYPLF